MIDTHAHLDFEDFNKDREEVISRFFRGGGKAIINVGVDLERSRKSIEITEKHEGVFAAVGFHPDFFSQGSTFPPASSADSSRSNIFLELKKIAKHKKVVAIGECGLDYFHTTHNIQHITQKELDKIKENQRTGFIAQINLAKELNLPVIVHCREVHPVASGKTPERFGAWEDLYEIISEFSQSSAFVSSKVRPSPLALREERGSSKPSFMKFVLHCYSGEKKDTEKFLKLPDVYFSFSGNITYPKPAERAEQLEEAVRMVPLDRIMLDSDAPFLAPQCRRGKRNEPIFVKYIAKKIAEIKRVREKEVERKTDENAESFFGI